MGDESAPEFEQEGSEVTLDMATNEQGDIGSPYAATFDNGDARCRGQFEMEMPVVDDAQEMARRRPPIFPSALPMRTVTVSPPSPGG
ncbi:MAG: hypothetical protein IPN77_14995 [Sandaracinaceae bacterium]|nr:hypothetical protein [Sandaracinaceae bacterium]